MALVSNEILIVGQNTLPTASDGQYLKYTSATGTWAGDTIATPTSSLTHIETKTLDGSTATTTFSSITSRKMYILMFRIYPGHTTVTSDYILMQLAGDTGNNYVNDYRINDANTSNATPTNSAYIGRMRYIDASNIRGCSGIVAIPNWQGATGVNRTGISIIGQDVHDHGTFTGCIWLNSSDITSIKVLTSGGNNFKGSISLFYVTDMG